MTNSHGATKFNIPLSVFIINFILFFSVTTGFCCFIALETLEMRKNTCVLKFAGSFFNSDGVRSNKVGSN